MRCAIDESESATAAEVCHRCTCNWEAAVLYHDSLECICTQATEVLQKLRGAGARGTGAPMSISGVTLHRPSGGPLQPMPPGAASADKIWYKSSLIPRQEVLGQRRRLLVNARHSWVGDACLARSEDESSSPTPHPPRTPRNVSGGPGSPAVRNMSTAHGSDGTGEDFCMSHPTPSSTGAAPELPA